MHAPFDECCIHHSCSALRYVGRYRQRESWYHQRALGACRSRRVAGPSSPVAGISRRSVTPPDSIALKAACFDQITNKLKMDSKQQDDGEKYQELMREIIQRFRTKGALYSYLVEKTVSTAPSLPHVSLVVDLPATTSLLHPGFLASAPPGGEGSANAE